MDLRLSLLVNLLLILIVAKASPFFSRNDRYENDVEISKDILPQLSHLEHLMFGIPSNATGEKVAEWHIGAEINPEELGEYAEGDILFPRGLGRNGLSAESTRWPGGVVPYVISPYFNPSQKGMILEAMAQYHEHTCIKFKPYQGEESDYIRITAGNTGCWSSVGRIGGVQDVNLQIPGCVTKIGTVIHELMHAVGFLHEQSRYERDDFVTIVWDNIMPNRRGNFEKATRKSSNAFGVGYDYGSVMHYSENAFTINGRPTIVPKEPGGLLNLIGEMFQGKTKVQLGQREGFSKKDIQKIRRMYKCGYRKRSFFN